MYPRWRDSSTVLFSANNEKDVPGLYAVGLAGNERRLDRRNDATDNDPVGEHTVVPRHLVIAWSKFWHEMWCRSIPAHTGDRTRLVKTAVVGWGTYGSLAAGSGADRD